MYVIVDACIYECMYVPLLLCTCITTCPYIYVSMLQCKYVVVNLYMYVSTYLRFRISMNLFMYVSTYLRIYVCRFFVSMRSCICLLLVCKPERNPAVRSAESHNNVGANLNSSLYSRFPDILGKIPALRKQQLDAQLNYLLYWLNRRLEVQLHLFNVCNLCCAFVVEVLLYCVNRSSAVPLHCCTICELRSTFVVKLSIVQHKSCFRGAFAL